MGTKFLRGKMPEKIKAKREAKTKIHSEGRVVSYVTAALWTKAPFNKI